MDRHESLDYWLALTQISGLGALSVFRAWRFLGTPKALFEAPVEALQSVGIKPKAARALSGFKDWHEVVRLRRQIADLGAEILALDDARYPESLARIADPPPVLFAKGRLETLQSAAIAVVGARQASDLGRHFAYRLGNQLANRGLCVVLSLIHI